MGQIGLELPKLLWPIFEKTLIELQIAFAKELGCKNIFINTHFLHKSIHQFVHEQRLPDVHLVYEPTLLNIGGAIHNIAQHPLVQKKGPLLILNGDQFYFFPRNYIEQGLEQIKQFKAILFGLEVDKTSGYNEIVLQDQLLQKIESTSSAHKYQTYSGVALVNLDLLRLQPGPSKFFDTVANYRTDKIAVITPGQHEYWDWGTTTRYKASSFRLLDAHHSHNNGAMVKFGQQHSIFDQSKIKGPDCYGTNSRGLINLTTSACDLPDGPNHSIIVLKGERPNFRGNGIYYNEIFEIC